MRSARLSLQLDTAAPRARHRDGVRPRTGRVPAPCREHTWPGPGFDRYRGMNDGLSSCGAAADSGAVLRRAGWRRARSSSICCANPGAAALVLSRLNFLLNEQPDKAIESFIEVVKVDPQTIDLHFALGSLFRRQGEIERATRMHQNLLDRPNLPADSARPRCSSSPRISTVPASRSRRGAFTKLDGTPSNILARFPDLDLRAGEGLSKAIAVTRRMEAIAKRPYFGRLLTTIAPRTGAARQADIAAARPSRLALANTVHRARHDAARRYRIAGRQRPAAIAACSGSNRRTCVPLARRRTACRCLSAQEAPTGAARRGRLSAGYPSLDLLNTMFTLTCPRKAPAAGISSRRADRTRRCSASIACSGAIARGAPERRTTWNSSSSWSAAHQASRALQMRALRLSRPPVLLACPGCGKWELIHRRRTETPDGYA